MGATTGMLLTNRGLEAMDVSGTELLQCSKSMSTGPDVGGLEWKKGCGWCVSGGPKALLGKVFIL